MQFYNTYWSTRLTSPKIFTFYYFIFLDEVSIELIDLAIEDNTECNFDKLLMRFILEDREQTVCGQNLNDVRFQRIFEGVGPVELIFTSDGSATLSGFRLRYSGMIGYFLVDHVISMVNWSLDVKSKIHHGP